MAKKWTPSEEKFLLDNYGKVPMAELADKFGVTRKAISAKLDKLRQAHGIDPVGARERAAQKTGRPSVPGSPPPSPGGAIPRPLPKREELKVPRLETLESPPPANMVASGMVVKTEKGWHPLFVEKKKVSN
jgi:hypothetical protein